MWHVLMVQGLSVDVHGLADGLKGLVEAGLAKAAGQPLSHLPASCQKCTACSSTVSCSCMKRAIPPGNISDQRHNQGAALLSGTGCACCKPTLGLSVTCHLLSCTCSSNKAKATSNRQSATGKRQYATGKRQYATGNGYPYQQGLHVGPAD